MASKAFLFKSGPLTFSQHGKGKGPQKPTPEISSGRQRSAGGEIGMAKGATSLVGPQKLVGGGTRAPGMRGARVALCAAAGLLLCALTVG